MDRLNVSVATVAGLLLLCGCDEDEHRLKFSHFIHVEDNGMECAECHGEAVDGRFLPITHAACMDCHEETESEAIVAETCGYCHAGSKPADFVTRPAQDELQEQSVFVHSTALAESCRDCHNPLMAKKLSAVPAMSLTERLRIREMAHGAGMECAECHVGLSRDREPDSHDALWIRQHGAFGGQDEAVCSVCHADDSCRECHSVMQPASHNNQWRLDTHGAFAEWNREGCTVCHEEDTCISCHSQVKPRSHTSLWVDTHGSGDSGRCMVCHEPEGCNACHSEMAPSSHNGSWEESHGLGDLDSCYVCHTPDTCTSCHQTTRPSSHTGSWNELHCTPCHLDLDSSCVLCHENANDVIALHEAEWPQGTHRDVSNQTDCLECH